MKNQPLNAIAGAAAGTTSKFSDLGRAVVKSQTYGIALDAMKAGKRVAREGWNGKGMFVFMRPGDTLPEDFLPKVKSLPESVKDFLTKRGGGVVFTPYLCMYAADSSIVNGWLASQTDMLASDWVILD